MSDRLEKPWSDNPNAPQIKHSLYLAEKGIFAGFFIAAALYGTATYYAPTYLG